MLSREEITEAFEQIGARVRVSPAGLDFRVEPNRHGVEVHLRHDDQGPYFDIRVNYTRVVDLRVPEVDSQRRQLVLVADDWGQTIDAPPLVFRFGMAEDGWFVANVTENSV